MDEVVRMLGHNIKVHYAGAEQYSFSKCAAIAGVKYYLFTVLPFIGSEMGVNTFPPLGGRGKFIPHEIAKFSKHTIMDSGLFTLMFGAQAGKRDEAFLTEWQERLCNFVNTNKLDVTCVEVDAQRVLGVEEAWKFRTKLRDMLPNNRQINVFHIPDGKKGLDRLIEFSEYIAISVPELRLFKGKSYKEDVYKLSCYIKNRKPAIDIHLLGCTEDGLLKRCSFCTSSDSTSWVSCVRFGNVLGRHISQVDRNLVTKYWNEAKAHVIDTGMEPTEERVFKYARICAISYLYKLAYIKAAGSQE